MLKEESVTVNFQQALTEFRKGRFRPPDNPNLQFGYTDVGLWLALKVNNPHEQALTRALEFRYAPLDRIDVYPLKISEGSGVPSTPARALALGDRLPRDERAMSVRFHLAELVFEANSDYLVLMRIQTTSSLAVPLYMSSYDALYAYEHNALILIAMFYGLALGLIAYNFFLFVLIRDTVYLHYIFYVTGYTLFMASLDGLLHPLWPRSPDWESRSIYLFAWICGAFLSLLCRSVLQTAEQAPRCDLVLRINALFFFAGCVLFLFMDIGTIARINAPMVLLNAFLILFITVYRYLQGHRSALYFLIGIASFCVGLLAVAGGSLNWVGNYDMAPFILKAGASIELVLFSIALAQRINMLERKSALATREAALAKAESEARARLSQQMNEANRHLESAVRARTDFLANMSHEIRTPMNGILGMVELAQGTTLNPEQKHYLDVAYRSGKTLLALINDILDLSKIEAGRLEIQSIEFDLSQLIADLEELFSAQLKDKALSFQIDHSPAVPTWVRADRMRIWQILTNLIGNAIKFTREGGILVRIRPSGPDQLQIQVQDTGIGIGEKALTRIFDSFTQADNSTTRKFGGTGLGLTISLHLARLMGGDLTVRSEKGKGSEFILSIPYQEASEETTNETDKPIQQENLNGSCEGLVVLLAEDNPVNQMVAMGMLKRLGAETVLAKDGDEAIAHCDERLFDVILMDVQMPGTDGLSASESIRSGQGLNHRTPIIALTADSMVGDRDKCLAAGMQDYLSKPVQLPALQKTLRRWTTSQGTGA